MKTQKKQLSDIKVHEIMTRHVHSLMANDSIQEAVRMMLDTEITTIPVIRASDNHCIGILSRSDLTELFLQEDDELSRVMDTPRLSMEWLHRSLDTCDARQVKELMTYEVKTIHENQSLPDACRELVSRQIHHLPVIDDNERITGILSTFDVVKAVSEYQ